jgi:hypothetical protein
LRYITIAVAIGALLMPETATAAQTEVDLGTMEWKRVGLAKWHRKMERLAAAEAEEEESVQVPVVQAPISGDVAEIIRSVFGAYGEQAVSVASCESGLSSLAVNGQYFGLFQMGESERATYGGSSTDPLEQTQAAHAYFMASGSDWSPWSMGACA